MLINQFIADIENQCSQICTLCVKHMTNKIYNNINEIDESELIEFFSNYNNYNKYLNDYAGTIYNKHASSIDIVYTEVCNFLKIDIDNQYTLEHVIIKLERQEPSVILGLVDDDIQTQTIENFDEKLYAVLHSTYFNSNKEKFDKRVEKLSKNITLVKNALQIK